MKKYLFTILTVIALTLGALSVPAQAAPAPATAGVVDFSYLIDHHPDTAAANQTLKEEQEKLKKQYQEQSATLDDAQKKALDLQLGQQFEQKRRDLLKVIADKVIAAIQDVATAKGLSIVNDRKSVVWGGVDITQEVLTKLNGK